MPGRSKEQQRFIDRHYRGMPLRDADAKVLLVVNDDDNENAVPGDPEQCAIARTCRRTLGSTAVGIFRRVAYIDVPREDGTREVLRFRIPLRTFEVIKQLDSGQRPDAGTYYLQPPAKSDRLDVRWSKEHTARRRKLNKEARDRYYARRKAVINGEIDAPTTGKRLVAGMDGYIRSGTGLVHMRPKRS